MLQRQNRELQLSDSNWIAILIAGLCTLLILRLVALAFNATDLFYDESQYWFWSTTPDFGYYSKPPLIAWLIGASTTSCGLSEFCVRLPSPLLHTATAIVIFFLGRYLYDVRIGTIAGLVYATLPGVSVSSGIISTDVPLLLCWAVALLALAHMFDSKSYWPALVLGIAIGGGLNAKYAMAWFFVCLAVYLIATPSRRWILTDLRFYAALALGVAMIIPNVLWNLENKFATFSHTADNANWSVDIFHPIKAIEFVISQFGLFGPILFASLLIISWRAFNKKLPERDRLLLAFSLPVLIIITLQALLSRAHANWAAASYIAATVLVTATLVRDLAWPWIRASLGLHIAALIIVITGTTLAESIAFPFGIAPFSRTLGWQEVAKATSEELKKARSAGQPYGAILCDHRSISAALLYYLKDNPTPVYAWRGKRPVKNHFQLTKAYSSGVPEPVLLVTIFRRRSPPIRSFDNAQMLETKRIPAGPNSTRKVTFFALKGYKGE